MLRKRFLTIGLSLLVVAIMAACVAPPAATPPAAGEAPAAEVQSAAPAAVAPEAEAVTLQFWTWFPPLPITEKIIAAFEAENPGINVEVTILESTVYQDKLPLSLAGGEALDLVAIQTGAMVNQVKDELMPLDALLTEYVGADWASRVNEKAVAQSRALADDGDLYILPMGGLGSVVGYYNVEILAEYGLTVPTTNEEFKAFAADLKAQNPDMLPVVFTGANWFQDEILLTLVGQTSPSFFNDIRYGDGKWNDPVYVQALKEYKQMYDDGILSMDAIDLDYSRSLEIFYSGEAAILLQGTWEAGVLSESFRQDSGIDLADVGLMPLPLMTGAGTPSIRSFIELGMAVPHNAAHPAEAMKLLEFMVFGNGVDAWAPAFIVVPGKIGYELPASALTSDAARAGYATLVDLVQNPSSDRNNVSAFSAVVGDGIIEVLNGADAQEVADALQAEWESGRYAQ